MVEFLPSFKGRQLLWHPEEQTPSLPIYKGGKNIWNICLLCKSVPPLKAWFSDKIINPWSSEWGKNILLIQFQGHIQKNVHNDIYELKTIRSEVNQATLLSAFHVSRAVYLESTVKALIRLLCCLVWQESLFEACHVFTCDTASSLSYTKTLPNNLSYPYNKLNKSSFSCSVSIFCKSSSWYLFFKPS